MLDVFGCEVQVSYLGCLKVFGFKYALWASRIDRVNLNFGCLRAYGSIRLSGRCPIIWFNTFLRVVLVSLVQVWLKGLVHQPGSFRQFGWLKATGSITAFGRFRYTRFSHLRRVNQEIWFNFATRVDRGCWFSFAGHGWLKFDGSICPYGLFYGFGSVSSVGEVFVVGSVAIVGWSFLQWFNRFTGWSCWQRFGCSSWMTFQAMAQ